MNSKNNTVAVIAALTSAIFAGQTLWHFQLRGWVSSIHQRVDFNSG